jgi:Fe-S cluster assembly protein SufD
MIQDFETSIKNIKNISLEEKKSREESLNLFHKEGFPSKKLEDWKFTDLNKIIIENFKELQSIKNEDEIDKIKLIKDFEHNSLILINGTLSTYDLKYEDAKEIKITKFREVPNNKNININPLINLNNALFEGGYSLEIGNNYKLNKPLVIYNYFSSNLKNKIINNKNLIKLNNNSTLDIVELNLDTSKYNFIQNNHTSIFVGEKATLKNYTVQSCKSNGFNYKFIKSNLEKNSNYEDYIFSSGLKFNKIEEDIDINGEYASCTIQSGLFINKNSHQEIKTNINHLKPNCKSYQKIKNVLNEGSKGVYQGKIFVKDIAQKTDAYQLSKALLLDDSTEFNAKPELEIYADDVKCSHGSTSGNINEDSIYYLMTRGLPKKNAIELLTKAFLFEAANNISNPLIKKFIEKNLDEQIYGYRKN